MPQSSIRRIAVCTLTLQEMHVFMWFPHSNNGKELKVVVAFLPDLRLALLMEFASKSKTHFDSSFAISLAKARGSFSELQM